MRRIGDTFELRARRHLQKAGLAPVAHNYSTRFGELDLVMRDGDTLVFVEVRYRRNAHFGGAAASVTSRKRERLIRAASGFLAAHPQYADGDCRFDVVTFEGDGDKARCHWQQAAFDAF
ncbi:MAG TPA: YraN family protein [Rhodanobacteraceae bacterium]|nr:YraN family protein [Rhodanobacteraceae bacterium]